MDATGLTILLMGLALAVYAALDLRERLQERRTEDWAWALNSQRDSLDVDR